MHKIFKNMFAQGENKQLQNIMTYNIELKNIKHSGQASSKTSTLQIINGLNNVSIKNLTKIVFIESNANESTLLDTFAKISYPETRSTNIMNEAKSFAKCAISNLTRNQNAC